MSPAQDRQEAKESDRSNSREERIRRRAYELYLARGHEPGIEIQDWVRAEEELKREEEAARLWRLGH